MNKIYVFELLSEGLVDEIRLVEVLNQEPFELEKLNFRGILQRGLRKYLNNRVASVTHFGLKISESRIYLRLEEKDPQIEVGDILGLHTDYNL